MVSNPKEHKKFILDHEKQGVQAVEPSGHKSTRKRMFASIYIHNNIYMHTYTQGNQGFSLDRQGILNFDGIYWASAI